LLARARTYLSAGDVAAARLVLRRAAERDDPQAALALGGTYDPTVLKRLGIVNFQADPAQAKDWYRRAAQLGSLAAWCRLKQQSRPDS
jgi:TPR repeat protein